MLQFTQSGHQQMDNDAPSASSLLAGNKPTTEVGRVYNEIFDAVMDRRLLPGAKLTETTLCTIFTCSRTVIRGALAALAHDKIVNIEVNRGAFVRQPDVKETADIFELRREIECLIIHKLLALDNLDDHLDHLERMVQREREAFESGKRISWIRLSNAFHVEMTKILQNDVLTELMHTLCARSTLIIAYQDIAGEHACSFFEHQEILDLLRARNRTGALQAMQHHLEACEKRPSNTSAKPDPWQAFSIQRS